MVSYFRSRSVCTIALEGIQIHSLAVAGLDISIAGSVDTDELHTASGTVGTLFPDFRALIGSKLTASHGRRCGLLVDLGIKVFNFQIGTAFRFSSAG